MLAPERRHIRGCGWLCEARAVAADNPEALRRKARTGSAIRSMSHTGRRAAGPVGCFLGGDPDPAQEGGGIRRHQAARQLKSEPGNKRRLRGEETTAWAFPSKRVIRLLRRVRTGSR